MSTITLTLEVSDDLAERLAAMDPERRQRFAVAALERFANLSPSQREEKFRLQAEERRALKVKITQESAEGGNKP